MSRDAYATIRAQLAAFLADTPGLTSALATAAALLKAHLEKCLWVGFYLPEPDGSLSVGPYQGPPAGQRLPPGRGVCQAAAERRASVVVPDVSAFPGHIACDPRGRSEIVVPVLKEGRLLAVLDLDSERPGAFDEEDRRELETIAALVAAAVP